MKLHSELDETETLSKRPKREPNSQKINGLNKE
jgi:hypothetical protein